MSSIIIIILFLFIKALLYKKRTILKFTHIILDEIHVRSIEDDFIMFIVRMIATQHPDKKIILMSATLQADLFINYFDKFLPPNTVAKSCVVGTKCFNVDTYFIDQLQSLLENLYLIEEKTKELHAAEEVKRLLLECDTQLKNQPKITSYAKMVCTNLIISLIDPGQSVLVFLPGLSDIADYYGELTQELKTRKLEHRFRIFGFHPRFIPVEEQREVFDTPPRRLIHVIIAGRAAESSITFKGLKLVINFGVRRVFEYNNIKRTNHLVMKWCSHSSCIQREGRVGRIEDGIAIHLFTKDFYDNILPEFDSPRINTVPLSKTTLQAKVVAKELGIKLPSQLLGSLIEPPPFLSFEASLEDLTESGALSYEPQKGVSEEADMTLLGKFCLSPKLDLVLGKIVLMGIFFGCPLDGIVMAAALSLPQDTFTMPTIMVMKDSQKFQESLERSINKRFHYDDGSFSNLIMMRNMFVDWLEYKHKTVYHHYHGRMMTDRDLAVTFSYKNSTRADRLLIFQFQVADIATEILKLIPCGSDMHSQVKGLASILNSTKAATLLVSPYPGKQDNLASSPVNTTLPQQKQTGKYIPPHLRTKQKDEFSACELRFCNHDNFLKSIILASTSNQVLSSKKCLNNIMAKRIYDGMKELKLHIHRTIAVQLSVEDSDSDEESEDEDGVPYSDTTENVGSIQYRPLHLRRCPLVVTNTSIPSVSTATRMVSSEGIQRQLLNSDSDDDVTRLQAEYSSISADTVVRKLKRLAKKLPSQYSYKIDSLFLTESVIGLVEVTPMCRSSQEEAHFDKQAMAVSSLPGPAVLLCQLGEGNRIWKVDDIHGVIFEDVFHPCEIEWQRLTTEMETVNPVIMNWRNPSSLVCDLHFSPHPHLAVASSLIGSANRKSKDTFFYATSLTVLPPIPKGILMVLAFQTLTAKVEFLINDCDKTQPITAVKINSCIIEDVQIMPHHIIQINKLRAMLSKAIMGPLSRSEGEVLPTLLWELLEESCNQSATAVTDASLHFCDPKVDSTSDSYRSGSLWKTVLPGIEAKYTIADIMGDSLLAEDKCTSDIIPCYPLFEYLSCQEDNDIGTGACSSVCSQPNPDSHVTSGIITPERESQPLQDPERRRRTHPRH